MQNSSHLVCWQIGKLRSSTDVSDFVNQELEIGESSELVIHVGSKAATNELHTLQNCIDSEEKLADRIKLQQVTRCSQTKSFFHHLS